MLNQVFYPDVVATAQYRRDLTAALLSELAKLVKVEKN